MYYAYKYVFPMIKFPKRILNAIKLSTKTTQIKPNTVGRSLAAPFKSGNTGGTTQEKKDGKHAKLKAKMLKVKKKADMIKQAMEIRLAKSA